MFRPYQRTGITPRLYSARLSHVYHYSCGAPVRVQPCFHAYVVLRLRADSMLYCVLLSPLGVSNCMFDSLLSLRHGALLLLRTDVAAP